MKLANHVKAYTNLIKAHAANRLCQQVVNLGLPTLWLYYRALGLESGFITLLKNVNRDITQVKEILYGIDLINQSQSFYPRVPAGLLNIALPRDVQAAQVLPSKANSLAYVFDVQTITNTLQEIMQTNLLLTIGNHYRTIGVTQAGNKYHCFKSGDQQPQTYSDLKSLSRDILRYLAGNNQTDQQQQALIIQSLNMPNTFHFDNSLQIATKLLKNSNLHDDILKEGLRFAVEAGNKELVRAYKDIGVPLNLDYMGGINLLYIAWHKTHSDNQMLKFLKEEMNVVFTSEQRKQLETVLPPNTFKRFIQDYNNPDSNHSNRSKQRY